jgi:hypothetical protein
MLESAGTFLHAMPLLCLFLSIVLGTIIGRFHFKGVGLGSVVGTLIAGIIIGILAKPELPEMLRWSFFYCSSSPSGTRWASVLRQPEEGSAAADRARHWSWHSQGSPPWSRSRRHSDSMRASP